MAITDLWHSGSHLLFNLKQKPIFMKKVLFLVVGLILLIDLIYSFTSEQTVASIFGYDYNIWIYRGFKLTLFLLIANAYYIMNKKSKDTNNR